MVSSWFDSAWGHQFETLDVTGVAKDEDCPKGQSFFVLVCQ